MWYALVVAIAAGLAAWPAALYLASRRRRNQVAAIERLRGSLDQLGEVFRAAAQLTGKPRGLRWKCVRLGPGVEAATDNAGTLVALVEAEIAFEAVPGGGMEEVAAVSNLRSATALFNFRSGAWCTQGRAVFNHTPEEVLSQFAEELTPTLHKVR